MSLKPFRYLIFTGLLTLVLAACGKGSPTPLGATPSPKVPPTSIIPTFTLTPTPAPPTSTPIPLAASINGAGLTLAEYQAELARFQAAQAAAGTILATDPKQRVLAELIDQILLSQAAHEQGFTVDDTLLQARLDALKASLGGDQPLADWINAHSYTAESFRTALARSIAAAWMRDQLAYAVPETADQVHVRQILLYNSDQAAQVLAQLQSGTDFAELAAKYDPVKAGDLGWFPQVQGYLTEPAVVTAAFNLEPGKFSEVLQTRLGYHIIQVIERDPQHPLTPDARQTLQIQAVRVWLEQRRSQSDIQILVP